MTLVPCAKRVPATASKPPIGFPNEIKNLAKDISREVLRIQPEQMLMFIVDFLEGRMSRRDMYSEIRKELNEIIDKFSFDWIMLQRGVTKRMLRKAAIRIQTAWRSYLARKEARIRQEMRNDQWKLVKSLGLGDDLDWQTLQRSAVLIQYHYRKYRQRKYKEIHKSKDHVGIYEMRKDYYKRLWTRITPFEAFNAAIKIQRIFRNFILEKRRVKDFKLRNSIQAKYYLKSLFRRVSFEEANAAAKVLQRFYWMRYRLALFRRFVEAVVMAQRLYMGNRQARLRELQKKIFLEEGEVDEYVDTDNPFNY